MTLAPATTAVADSRAVAFCDRAAPEVFHAVANPTEIWRADPFDVDAIHAGAIALILRTPA